MFSLSNRYGRILITAIILSMIVSIPAGAADIGGKLSLIDNLSYFDSDFDNSLAAELELEWYLPYDAPLDIQNRVVINFNQTKADEFDLWFKKLYLKEDLGPFDLSIGRQPVSWSYGALINPVDYSLGAENLEEESKAKYVDGIELYYPINWGSGLTFVVSNLEDQKENKWALRGRTTLAGYDLSASYVKTPEEESDLERYGLTFKGDLGPFGLYGAYGLWQNSEIDYDIYQIGGDYSYHFLAGSQLYLQGEYLRIEGVEGDITSFDFFNLSAETEDSDDSASINNLNFINTNLSYDIDEFSSIGIMTVSYLDDGSTLFIPNYSYLFSSNLLLELRGSIAAGSEDEVLGGDAKALEINLSYTF